MQIAYDARPLNEQRTGIGRYVRCILEALLARPEIREILLCSPRKISAGDALGRDPRVKEKVQRGWKGNVWLQLVIPFLLERCKPDVFHATLFLSPILARRPCVVNIYDLTVYRYPGTMEGRNKWLLRLLLPKAVSQARRIITLSEFTKREISERWPEASHKIVVVPGAPCLSLNTPPGNSCRPDEEKVLQLYGIRRPYVLYVGTLEPRKNVVRMLKAFEQLHAMGAKEVQLVLVGPTGWGLGEVRRAWDACPVRSAVRYIGYVPDEVLGVFYRSADVFLYLSLYEGFGFPPLEAMASGTCVVASNRGSLPESLGDAAVLADPLDTQSIAEALLTLCRDEGLRMNYVGKGLQHLEKYSWRKSAQKTLEVYQDLF